MEVLRVLDHYILVSGEQTLWCSRKTGSLTPRRICSLAELIDPECIGVVSGIVGKFRPTPDSVPYLVVIRESALVGMLPDRTDVFKINRVALLPLSETESLTAGHLDLCRKHHASLLTESAPINPASPQRAGLQKTWNTFKSATSSLQSSRKSSNAPIPAEKYEQRLLDELVKMFDNTDSFFFSSTGDLTNSLQRKAALKKSQEANQDQTPVAPWKFFDRSYFWNYHMISEILEHPKLEEVIPWVLPIIHGFVQIDRLAFRNPDAQNEVCLQQNPAGTWVESTPPSETRLFNMILISRRSCHRAGTRFKRRGVDNEGHCANFVETEQIFEVSPHVVSFVLTRGSVPLFWSQPGYKYRPPPQLDRSKEENCEAFKKHFDKQLELYGRQVIVSLVENQGKEGIIARAYLEHVLNLDEPKISYVSFDFHEYCRGMNFGNVSILIDKLKDSLTRDSWSYLWMDGVGAVCEQTSVFRVNCMDCLDRTNVVQTAIAREIMKTQFIRLGLMLPESNLPGNVRQAFQATWANNGDTVSRQYAGTAALKGDYTRTGSRKLSGLMKDGYNSANRYYLNRFRDAYRQAVIDLMLGNPVEKEDVPVSPDQGIVGIETLLDQHEHVRQLIEDCKRLLMAENEVCLGGWALIDADPTSGDNNQQQQGEMDTILLLTKDSYYVAEYDDLSESITRFQRVLIEDLEKLEMGPEPSLNKSRYLCLRLHYSIQGQGGFFHMFRAASTRFFNNVPITISSEDEAAESLRTICESLKMALAVKNLNVPFYEGKLERRRSKLTFTSLACSSQSATRNGPMPQLELPNSMPRNISEGQLMNFVGQVGSKALSSMSSQLSRLNPMKKSSGQSKESPQEPAFGGSSQAILMTVSESANEDRISPEPGSGKVTPLEPLAPSQIVPEHMDRAVSSVHLPFDKGSVQTKFVQHNASSIDRTMSSDYSESSDPLFSVAPNEIEKLTEDCLLESCGILASSCKNDMEEQALQRRHSQTSSQSSGQTNDPYDSTHHMEEMLIDGFVIDAMRTSLSRVNKKNRMPSGSLCLTTSGDDYNFGESGAASKSSTQLDSPNLSKACSERQLDDSLTPWRSSSELGNGTLKTSHSENEISPNTNSNPRSTSPTPLSRPNPLSKFAKNVQSFGQNVLSKGNHKPASSGASSAELAKLDELKAKSRCLIIEI